ncbi:MAG: hypothetical protein KDA25_01030 [Phycisphaerales bacterium]|nr:hypothetical protein [Phycisphaerales bacterium]
MMQHTGLVLVAAIGTLTAAVTAGNEPVDVRFDRTGKTVFVGDLIEIDIIVSADGPDPQPFAALDAILSWDPSFMVLLGVDDSNAGAPFFISSFLPDPDGINADLTDGDALYTALAPPGNPVNAPPAPGQLIVTTVQFTALAPTPGTPLAFIPELGRFGETRVLLSGMNITGDISSIATIEILAVPMGACCVGFGDCMVLSEPDCDDAGGQWNGDGTDCFNGDDDIYADLCDPCQWDLDNSGAIDPADLAILLAAWATDPGGPPDFNGDGDVDPVDLAKLLANWGPCPTR